MTIKQLAQYVTTNEDVNNAEIQKTAKVILQSLPRKSKQDTMLMIEATVAWIDEHIESLPAPRFAIDLVASIIAELPAELKLNPLAICAALDYSREEAENIVLDPALLEKGYVAVAKQFIRKYDYFSYCPPFNDMWSDIGYSAHITLEHGGGKCVHKTNLYSAIAQAMGIPTMQLGGMFSDGSNLASHSWAASYVEHLGFVEVEPTLGIFRDFTAEKYLYQSLWVQNNLSVYELDTNTDEDILYRARPLLEQAGIDLATLD